MDVWILLHVSMQYFWKKACNAIAMSGLVTVHRAKFLIADTVFE